MNLIECLCEVKDPRRSQGQRYGKVPLLLIIIMAMLRNKYGYREIGRFCKINEKQLLAIFNFTNKKVPSHVTFRSFILEMDFDSIQNAFYKWASNYVPIEKGEWINVDGKSIRSTVSDYDSSYQNFVSLISLFVSKKEQVLTVAKLENKKGNEAQIVTELLALLDLQDVTFTLDALHCKKNATSNHRERKSLSGKSKRQST